MLERQSVPHSRGASLIQNGADRHPFLATLSRAQLAAIGHPASPAAAETRNGFAKRGF
jgi:hypothetical protein